MNANDIVYALILVLAIAGFIGILKRSQDDC
jgi:hypothetical protein